MIDSSNVLSDEFVAYSLKIKEINEEKKAKKAEFKVLYDKFQVEMRDIEARAKALTDEFNAWEKTQKTNPAG
jgi:hypothetical protein